MSNATSGQKAVTTAGTAVRIASSNEYCHLVSISALSGNTGSAYVGNDGAGDVTTSNGYELRKDGPPIVMVNVDLYNLIVDVANNGDGICWIKIS